MSHRPTLPDRPTDYQMDGPTLYQTEPQSATQSCSALGLQCIKQMSHTHRLSDRFLVCQADPHGIRLTHNVSIRQTYSVSDKPTVHQKDQHHIGSAIYILDPLCVLATRVYQTDRQTYSVSGRPTLCQTDRPSVYQTYPRCIRQIHRTLDNVTVCHSLVKATVCVSERLTHNVLVLYHRPHTAGCGCQPVKNEDKEVTGPLLSLSSPPASGKMQGWRGDQQQAVSHHSPAVGPQITVLSPQQWWCFRIVLRPLCLSSLSLLALLWPQGMAAFLRETWLISHPPPLPLLREW